MEFVLIFFLSFAFNKGVIKCNSLSLSLFLSIQLKIALLA